MLSFSTRFSRSDNLASAFRSDPCCFTVRSYSGPNFRRRSAVVLLRFCMNSHATTTITMITTPALELCELLVSNIDVQKTGQN